MPMSGTHPVVSSRTADDRRASSQYGDLQVEVTITDSESTAVTLPSYDADSRSAPSSKATIRTLRSKVLIAHADAGDRGGRIPTRQNRRSSS